MSSGDELQGGRAEPAIRPERPADHVATLSSYEDWMTGTFVYSDAFWALDGVGLRGERLAA